MPERQKPLTPRLDALRLEEEKTSVKLPDREELSRRLHEAILPENHAAAEERFIPILLQHAGETLNIAAAPALVVQALRDSLDERVNFRAYADKYLPRIVDALVDDERLRTQARQFLHDALSG